MFPLSNFKIQEKKKGSYFWLLKTIQWLKMMPHFADLNDTFSTYQFLTCEEPQPRHYDFTHAEVKSWLLVHLYICPYTLIIISFLKKILIKRCLTFKFLIIWYDLRSILPSHQKMKFVQRIGAFVEKAFEPA